VVESLLYRISFVVCRKIDLSADSRTSPDIASVLDAETSISVADNSGQVQGSSFSATYL
jgi:hypothetical protein